MIQFENANINGALRPVIVTSGPVDGLHCFIAFVGRRTEDEHIKSHYQCKMEEWNTLVSNIEFPAKFPGLSQPGYLACIGVALESNVNFPVFLEKDGRKSCIGIVGVWVGYDVRDRRTNEEFVCMNCPAGLVLTAYRNDTGIQSRDKRWLTSGNKDSNFAHFIFLLEKLRRQYDQQALCQKPIRAFVSNDRNIEKYNFWKTCVDKLLASLI